MKRLTKIRFVVFGLQLLALGGCVSQARYDEARSALMVEQEAHRRTNAQLYALSQKVDQLQARLSERERQLEESAAQISAAELAATQADTERDEAVATVEQLRGELARVGDHLRTFADQKQSLSEALDGAETRAKRLEELEKSVARNALIVRDVSVLLNEAIAMGEVELEIVEGRPLLRLEHASSFVAGSGDLQPGTNAVASALSRALRARPEARVRISRRADDSAQATAELERIAKRLQAEGLAANRIEIVVEPANGEPGPIELSVL